MLATREHDDDDQLRTFVNIQTGEIECHADSMVSEMIEGKFVIGG